MIYFTYFDYLSRNRLIKELQDEIQLETYNNEQKVQIEEEQMRERKAQLEKTWYRIHERRKAFMGYAFKCFEEDEVYILYNTNVSTRNDRIFRREIILLSFPVAAIHVVR